ncbi:hypothetical protein GCG54_00005337 [Colletotrichum gloeosporioides]|uniref:Uncharacterized protein n=1 Tax=Colletotrichum gloeosporioides TaxID=474922 RepID=A0A8H4FQT7_COLGL|nr:uncharacterized protein GCG54_00005337 [Colletotrichum gloeosporioides]KAF3809794.1 hypothetical protein GCG54_00005337 [Colletotrichum gloeosporioides]
MDPWGNVKIPYLRPESSGDWRDIRQDLTTDDYSSLAGVPLSDLNYDGKTTFSLESSYIQLQCSNITTSPLSEPDGSYRDMMRVDLLQSAFSDFISMSGARHIYELPNGTWHGVSSSRNISSSDTTWSLGFDRFIDPLWFGGNNTNFTEFRKGAKGSRAQDLHRLILFQDQKGIEAGPTRLLFQAKCKDSFHAPQLYFTGYCDVTQTYVESRVTCDRSTTTRQNCSGVAQRPSQQMHAPESITPLSFPVIFHDISQELPLAVGGDVSFQTETSLYYIKDPSLRSINGEERAFLENVTARDLGVRLGQLLNSYYQLTQLSLNITEGSSGVSIFEPNISVSGTTSRDVVVFGVSDGWATLCMASCAALLAAGILSVVLAHWAQTPEILGYVSTVFRDSRHIELEAESDRLTGVELSKTMMKERIRYGLVSEKGGEKLRMGVGRQEEIKGCSGNLQ